MRKFSYFLFENFDADGEAQNPLNPRRMLGAETDALLSDIASFPAGECPYTQDILVDTLIGEGILRRTGESILFHTPVFLKEDAQALKAGAEKAAAALADRLEAGLDPVRQACEEIQNGFPVERNLYHILCGMIFDGLFFDFLERERVVATSHVRASGLDYISVIYEKCEELDALSNGLLCSYNRFTDGEISLESFGDAQGDRHDLYRFFRLLEAGSMPERFQDGEACLAAFGGADRAALLAQAKHLLRGGICSPEAMALFEHFGYAKDGQLCVPVYTADQEPIIARMAKWVENWMGQSIAEALSAMARDLDITAVRHGVAPGEIANELYHILFGSINEELVSRDIVEAPPHIPGEGRFLRCIQL